MTKRIEREGKFYRIRRGQQVEIPAAWVGQTVFPETIQRRKSKRGQGKDFKSKCQR
jgi:hypothetical protein